MNPRLDALSSTLTYLGIMFSLFVIYAVGALAVVELRGWLRRRREVRLARARGRELTDDLHEWQPFSGADQDWLDAFGVVGRSDTCKTRVPPSVTGRRLI